MDKTQTKLPHEKLDVYRLYLEVASLCSDIVLNSSLHIAALDHLDRAVESIGINFIRGNGQPAGTAMRTNYLDISLGSVNECVAALDICLIWCVVDKSVHAIAIQKLWRIRGMLLGLKRYNISSSVIKREKKFVKV